MEPQFEEPIGPIDSNEIIVTESDVSHQSSFYEIPEERKQKLYKEPCKKPK